VSAPFDVVCVGSVTLDTIGVVERVPAADERVLSEPFVTAGGGPAATAAVTLARLGVRVAFCGVVGDDEAGRVARAQLADEGVDTRWLITRPGAATSRSVVLVERGSAARSIVATPSPEIMAADVPTDASSWLHADQHGYAAAARALQGRRDAGATAAAAPRLSVDAGNRIAGLSLSGVALYAPTVAALRARYEELGGAGDAAAGLDEALARAVAEGAESVVATDGAAGAHVLAGAAERPVHVPGRRVEVVSTLGAGDVFHGALLAGITDGLELADAAAFASVVAALSCRGLDGRSRIPDRAEAWEQFDRSGLDKQRTKVHA
jgi:sulfofructose kinase